MKTCSLFRLVAIMAAVLLLGACRQAQRLTVGAQRTDSVVSIVCDTVWRERVELRADSASSRDSVYVRQFVRQVVDSTGRVVRTDSVAERYELREQQRYTILQEQYRELEREYRALMQAYIDKRAEPYPVERELTRWERAKMTAGGLVMDLLALLALVTVVWVIFKIKG